MQGIDIGLDRVVAATGGQVIRRAAERFTAAVIDGRAAKQGALFFAVKGERFDGHDFVAQAVAAGATGAVVERGRGAALNLDSATVIEVDDPVRALGQLARAHRQAMGELKLVAITGSNGKTTTKDMTAEILAARAGSGAVLKTEGNLNNHLGVPLTLLRLTGEHRYAVVEMGMSALGEIEYLTGLAEPDVAVVVSVAAVHLETLGTVENVARAKGEIWKGLKPGGFAVLPVDEPRLLPFVAGVPAERRLTFGPRALSPTVGYDDVSQGPRGLRFRLHLANMTSRTGAAAEVALIGAHHASNAAAAAAAARALDVGEGSILEGLSEVRPAKHRGQLVTAGDRTVLDDCYNASPLSTRAALDALSAIAPVGKKRVALLGDMLELGEESARLHEEIGAYAAGRVDELIAFGPLSRHVLDGARGKLPAERLLHTDDPGDAAERALAVTSAGDVILVKGSRGMRLERVIDAMLERVKAG